MSMINFVSKQKPMGIANKTQDDYNQIMKMILQDKKRLGEFCRDNDIIYLGLFGSFARGEQKRGSDVDLLYKLKRGKKITLFGLADLKIGLEKILNRKVDFVGKDNIKKRLKPYIKKDLINIYGKRS